MKLRRWCRRSGAFVMVLRWSRRHPPWSLYGFLTRPASSSVTSMSVEHFGGTPRRCLYANAKLLALGLGR